MQLKTKSYATTLWELLRNKSLEEVNFTLDVLQILSRLYQIDADFKTWISHPLIPSAQKERQLQSFFDNQPVDAILINFIQLLVHNRYFASLPQIIHRLKLLRNDHFHFLPVQVTVSIPLSPAQRSSLEMSLEQKFNAEVISIHEKIDPGVLGGMVIEFEDSKIDQTVKHRLERITEKLAQGR